ncbi:MAG: methyltransferase domain-containing protein [Bacteroidota bacterium]
MSNYDYSAYTYNSKNPLARFSHRSRLMRALDLVPASGIERLLDYGCGDGQMLQRLHAAGRGGQLTGYDPLLVPDPHPAIRFCTHFRDLHPGTYDFMLCLEVLEHFGPANQERMLGEMKSLLRPRGRLLVSVPIETGLPSLVKNLRRLHLHPDHWHNWANTWKCLWGRALPELRAVEGFIPSHIGFNHRHLEAIFSRYFRIVARHFSPFPRLSAACNAQVFYQLEPL